MKQGDNEKEEYFACSQMVKQDHCKHTRKDEEYRSDADQDHGLHQREREYSIKVRLTRKRKRTTVISWNKIESMTHGYIYKKKN